MNEWKKWLAQEHIRWYALFIIVAVMQSEQYELIDVDVNHEHVTAPLANWLELHWQMMIGLAGTFVGIYSTYLSRNQ
jgi:hypothetical protein